MGYNIGLRLIDEFLAKSGVNACQDFRDTCDVIAKATGKPASDSVVFFGLQKLEVICCLFFLIGWLVYLR